MIKNMKEKEKLIKALKEIFDELETWISINDLFLMVNNEWKYKKNKND